MKAFRLTACLLAAVLLLSSCGIIVINRGEETMSAPEAETDFPPLTDTYKPDTYPLATETDGEGISRDRLGALPDQDFDGLTVFFTVSEETGHIFNDEDELYRPAVLMRNELVNEKYNTKIITQRKSAALLLTEVKAADRSGDFYSDFALIRGGNLGSYITEAYLHNLKSLPFTDYEAEYYRQSAMDQLTVDGVIYGAVGDAVEQIEHYACLYVNKSYGESLGYFPDYRAVYEGAFTWESFLISLSELPEETVRFVSSLDEEATTALSYFTTCGTYLSENAKGKLRLACETEASATLIDALKTLFVLDTTEWSAQDDETEPLTGFDIFAQGEALYAFGTLGQMELLENAGFVWEVLPLPKVTADMPYCTAVTRDAPVIVALASSQNIDTMGYILEAVNAASYGYITYSFYTDAMQRLITGVHTLDMLDIIRENPIYDIGYLLGEDAKAVREGTYGALYAAVEGSKSFSSYLSKKESALNKYLDGLT